MQLLSRVIANFTVQYKYFYLKMHLNKLCGLQSQGTCCCTEYFYYLCFYLHFFLFITVTLSSAVTSACNGVFLQCSISTFT